MEETVSGPSVVSCLLRVPTAVSYSKANKIIKFIFLNKVNNDILNNLLTGLGPTATSESCCAIPWRY